MIGIEAHLVGHGGDPFAEDPTGNALARVESDTKESIAAATDDVAEDQLLLERIIEEDGAGASLDRGHGDLEGVTNDLVDLSLATELGGDGMDGAKLALKLGDLLVMAFPDAIVSHSNVHP